MNRARVLLGFGAVLVGAAVILAATLLADSGDSSSAAPPATPPPATPPPPAPTRPAAVSTLFPAGVGNPDLTGKVQPFGNGSPSPIPPGVDGCDRNYADANGERSVCVPRVAPGGGPVDCAFLRRVGFPPLVVVGTDSKHLGGAGRPAAPGETVCAG